MATKIIKEIDLYDTKSHLKIGILFCIFLVFIFNLYKNIHNNESIPFEGAFNYVEGISNNSEVQIAGIKIGDVSKITISSDGGGAAGNVAGSNTQIQFNDDGELNGDVDFTWNTGVVLSTYETTLNAFTNIFYSTLIQE